jgi:hypothetical protein
VSRPRPPAANARCGILREYRTRYSPSRAEINGAISQKGAPRPEVSKLSDRQPCPSSSSDILFEPSGEVDGHRALLQKIFNNITTTSNVFGVWWTAGYFEVVDESVRPPRLGKEIGRDVCV